MHVGHLRLWIKSDIDLIKTAGAGRNGRYVELLRLLMHIFRHRLCTFAFLCPLDSFQKFVQFRYNLAGIPVHRVPVTDFFHFIGNEILYFQHMLYQL